MEQFLEKNQNLVMSVEMNGTVLYSNKAGELLLHEWGAEVGEKLPSSILDIVQKVITQNNPEKMEVKMGKRVYLVVFHPLPEQKCVNLYGFDISNQKAIEEKLRESEALEMTNLELADIIDIEAVQSLMDDFYKLAHITMALVDLKGNVLVSVGWQDICTKFHRVCPETCKHCMESDTKLSSGVSQGEFKLYKCKNNMWDIATPIIVGGQHVGNAFSGQFFFEDEPLEYELFKSQARKYGFNEEEYIAALEKVPHLSREDVNTGMSFVMTFANMVSQLGYSNFKLANSLAERDALVDALQENRKDLDRAQTVGNIGSWRLDVRKNELISSDEAHRIFGIPKGVPLTYETFLSIVHPDDREYIDTEWKAALIGEPYDIEYRVIVDGKIKWVREKAYLEFTNSGVLLGGFGITQDITERKKAESKLKKTLANLEKIVEERTIKLEKAYNSLKESEKGLAEAQKMAHIGNWEWEIATNKAYWSEEMYRIFGRDSQELAPTFNEYLSYIHPDDRDYVNNALNKAVKGQTHSIEYRIVLANGEERTVHMQSEVIFDEKNTPAQIRGIIQDITERKEAEEALANIEIARKKEIHHRIKNNLQVISSLLDLQADKFDDPKVIEAFRESQNRVISMALIHEELYKGEGNDTLDFSTYIRELAENLFQTYSLKSKNIHLSMDLEENVFLNMDTGVPLGIIVNELVSNSLKHAFPGKNEGEIRIELSREENGKHKKEDDKATSFILIVSDNGIGIPENLNIEDIDSLGIQLIITLVDQLDGELELKRDKGTEFAIKFTVKEEK